MGEFLLGAVVLVLLILLVPRLRVFFDANPPALAKVLRYAGAAMLATMGVGLFLIERPAVGVFVLSAAWGLFTGGHAWPHFGKLGGSGSSSGRQSSVRTAWLEMELDHDSGEMRGTVLQGSYAGRRLDQLGRDALAELYANAPDPETKRLLEAWFERAHGADWRDVYEKSEQPPPRAAAGMTRAEALKVLGLKDGASADEIRAAHRRLMVQNHPDRGGTDYLASKINEAKDVLLE
ncbi:MAG TPA: DnaJ domain-containing protein [Rhizomicrobium sp.]|nr:DnaJ domain-containing protein [Rhizomicrobium sp.]